MTGLVTSGEKRLVLVSGRAHIELAQQVGEELGCGVSPTTAYDFASGETYVRFNESVRGADVFVLQSHTPTRARIRNTWGANLFLPALLLICTRRQVRIAS